MREREREERERDRRERERRGEGLYVALHERGREEERSSVCVRGGALRDVEGEKWFRGSGFGFGFWN